jgi:AAHS family 4-hydroxybenzoate transporter-like MFS transporter
MPESWNPFRRADGQLDPHIMKVVICCFAIMLCDGYDLTVIAFAMPAIGTEWGVATTEFGYAFSASIVGVMIGAPFSGWLADRWGRKKILLCCVFAFGLAVLLTGFVHSMPQLIIARALSGLGLGGVIPLSIALVGECSPSGRRATLISIATTGMTVGAGLPALAAALMLPAFGWPSLFFLGGVVPFLIGTIAIFMLPESRQFAERHKIVKVGRSQNPLIDHQKKNGSGGIFSGDFAIFTPSLWSIFAAIGFASYFIQTWTPTLYLGLGRPLKEVAFSVSMFQVGGGIGGLLVGWVMDRFGPKSITMLFILAAPSVALLGFPQLLPDMLPLFLGISGFLLLALQLAANASAAIGYPTNMRARGIGLGMASTRLGQIISSLIGGILIAKGFSLTIIFASLSAVLLAGAATSRLLERCRLFGKEASEPSIY